MNKHRYKDPKLYRKLKHYWKLILKNSNALQNYKYNRYKLFESFITSKGIVDYILENNPSQKMVMRLFIHFVNVFRTEIIQNSRKRLKQLHN